MHVYFSGIGGTGISALAVIAKEAGYKVSGSDARPSKQLDWLRQKGITNTHVGVDDEFIAKVHQENPIDWYVYGSAQPMDFPDHPEFAFCDQAGIKKSKRDEFINDLLLDKGLKMIAIAGTHGKSTTTAMAIWLFKQLGLPLSYSGGAKISFGEMSLFDPKSQYFVYEADEFDRNFLAFSPDTSLIAGIDWDHPDIYPTRQEYYQAFRDFLSQTTQTFIWQEDLKKLELKESANVKALNNKAPQIDQELKLIGRVNRLNAWLVASALQKIVNRPMADLIKILNDFPGLARRFEQVSNNIYTDYAHTPAKIRGALQLAEEVAGKNVVVVYEGLHNTRQHFIKEELATLFDHVKYLYIVPSYLAREDPNLELLTPVKILDLLSTSSKGHTEAAALNDKLADQIKNHAAAGDLVICFSSGSGGSLDEWVRKEFAK